MAKSFGATSTTDEVLDGVSLSGKRALVTGVSAGLGVETAARSPLTALRSSARRAILQRPTAATAAGARRPPPTAAALSWSSSTWRRLRASAPAPMRWSPSGKPFDLVIRNAGVMATPFGKTADGFETQFGTNHLGHFVLVNRIASLMKPGARLVNLSSAGHQLSDVDLDDPNFERTPYSAWASYGRSKTANILFAVEFDRRHKERGIRAAALHPGAIRYRAQPLPGRGGAARADRNHDAGRKAAWREAD